MRLIAARVGAGRTGRAQPWGGAGVVITATPPLPPTGPEFYPDSLYVVTPHDRELSWLFQQLGSAYSDAIDCVSKFEFYGRLAEAANRYVGSTPEGSQTLQGLLAGVLAEATTMATEFQPYVDAASPEAKPGVLSDSGEM